MTTKIKEEYLCESLQIYDSDKYGEVFVTKTGLFTYYCIVCKQTYEDTENFTEHILTLHLGQTQTMTENITLLENKDNILMSLNISTNFLENEMNDHLTKESNKSTITFNKTDTDTSDPLDVCKLQAEQDEDKNPPEADKELAEFELSEIAEINNNCNNTDRRTDGSDSNEYENLEIFPFKCGICKKAFKMERALLLHKSNHESLMPNCQHCGKCFRKISTFKTHNQILCAQRIKRGHKLKLELPDIKCKYCEKNFKKPDSLKKHEELHEDSPFKCNTCPKIFMEKRLMEDHIRTHTGEKPFKCEYCSISLSNARNLRRHVLKHIGKKTVLCTFGCGKAFYKQRECTAHERTHTGEKPYVCELCGRYFAYGCKLSFHKKCFHTDKKNWSHKCDQCNKVFLTPVELRNHIVVHTGEKPYVCDQCPGRFSRASGLREHKKLHSGIKKHVCTICSKAFAQTAGLYSHMKSHGIIKKSTEIN